MGITFNGSTQYMDVGAAPVTSNGFTMGGWFYPTADATQCGMAVFKTGGASYADLLFITGPGAVRLQVDSGGAGSAQANTSANWSLNAWNHAIGISASATDHRAFLNGGNKGTNTDSHALSAMTNFIVGAGGTGAALGFYFTGTVAEAALWNAALTDGEAAALGAGVSPLRIRPDALLCYWPLYIAGNSPNYGLGSGSTRYNLTANNSPTQGAGARVSPPFGFSAGKRVASSAAAGGGMKCGYYRSLLGVG